MFVPKFRPITHLLGTASASSVTGDFALSSQYAQLCLCAPHTELKATCPAQSSSKQDGAQHHLTAAHIYENSQLFHLRSFPYLNNVLSSPTDPLSFTHQPRPGALFDLPGTSQTTHSGLQAVQTYPLGMMKPVEWEGSREGSGTARQEGARLASIRLRKDWRRAFKRPQRPYRRRRKLASVESGDGWVA